MAEDERWETEDSSTHGAVLWKDKHAPMQWADLGHEAENRDSVRLLKRLASDPECPHLCLYGPPGSGKRSMMRAFLHQASGCQHLWRERSTLVTSFRVQRKGASQSTGRQTTSTSISTAATLATAAIATATITDEATNQAAEIAGRESNKEPRTVAAATATSYGRRQEHERSAGTSQAAVTSAATSVATPVAVRKGNGPVVQVRLWQTHVHIEWDPTDRTESWGYAGSDHAHVIQHLLKHRIEQAPVVGIGAKSTRSATTAATTTTATVSTAATAPAATTAVAKPNGVKFRWMVIHHADQLSTRAQQSLRRMLETSAFATRVILLLRQRGRLIPALQSRFLHLRVPALTVAQGMAVLDRIARVERMPWLSPALARECFDAAERDLTRAIDYLENAVSLPAKILAPTASSSSSSTTTAAASTAVASSNRFSDMPVPSSSFYSSAVSAVKPRSTLAYVVEFGGSSSRVWALRPQLATWQMFLDVWCAKLLHDPLIDRCLPFHVPPQSRTVTTAGVEAYSEDERDPETEQVESFLRNSSSYAASYLAPWHTLRQALHEMLVSDHPLVMDNDGRDYQVTKIRRPVDHTRFLWWMLRCVQKRMDSRFMFDCVAWFAECQHSILRDRSRPIIHIERLALRLLQLAHVHWTSIF